MDASIRPPAVGLSAVRTLRGLFRNATFKYSGWHGGTGDVRERRILAPLTQASVCKQALSARKRPGLCTDRCVSMSFFGARVAQEE